MVRPVRTAVVALLIAVPLAGCAASTTDGTGSTGAPAASRSTSGSAPGSVPVTAPASGSVGASATTLDPLTGQRTALALDARFVSALATLKITPGLVGKATLQSTTVQFPITGGRLVVAGPAVSGRVEHAGSGLTLTSGPIALGLTDLTIDESAHVVTCTVTVADTPAATDAPVLTLDPAARRASPSGQGVVVTGEKASFTQAGATLLNTAFRTTVFSAGTVLGTLTITATG